MLDEAMSRDACGVWPLLNRSTDLPHAELVVHDEGSVVCFYKQELRRVLLKRKMKTAVSPFICTGL